MADEQALVVIALRTTDPHVRRRLETVLAIAATYDEPPNTSPCVFAKPVGELVARDLDRLAEIMGWSAVRDLNLGVDVVSDADFAAWCGEIPVGRWEGNDA